MSTSSRRHGAPHEASSRAARRQARRHGLWRVFRWPLLIGLASAAGLVSALVGDGVWDAVSWATLSLPLVVGLWFAWRRG